MRNTAAFFVVSVIVLSSFGLPSPVYSITSAATSSAQSRSTPKPTQIVPVGSPETGINLNISPVFINLVTDPGRPVSSEIRVQNNNNIREYLEFSLYKFIPNESGTQPVISDIQPDDPFPSWINFDHNQFVLEPNEVKTVKYTISPPKDAALGYYYAIAVNRMKEKEGKNSQAVIAAAPAMSVLLEVRSPYAKREIQLVEFTTDKPVYEYLPVEFRIRVKNTGNIHVVPFGDIFIDWGTKKDVGIVKANPARGNVLPQTERIFKDNWSDSFIVRAAKDNQNVEDKTKEIVYETKWDLQKADRFRIGKYTAHLLLVYDNGQRDIPVEAVVSFWVIPWKILGILAVVIIFTIIGVRGFILSLFSSVKKISSRK